MVLPDQEPVRIFLFGTPHVKQGEQLLHIHRRKAFALLAYLAVVHKPVSRSALAVLLSPDMDAARSNAELRRALAALKEVGLGDYVISSRETISLAATADLWIDVHEFDALLKQAWRVGTLQRAVNLYSGDFMQGFALRGSDTFYEWQLSQSQFYQQKFTAALEKLVQLYIQNQQYEAAIPVLEHWLTMDHLDEGAHRQAMYLYALTGKTLAALRIYENYAQRLQEELGTMPQQETTRLYEDIKAGRSPGMQPLPVKTAGKLPPVPPLVIGREPALAEIRALLTARKGAVVIQGWPGIGKTTIVSLLAHDADVHRTFTDGVLWVSLGNHPNVLAELKTWADAVGLPLPEEGDTPDQIASRLAAALKDKKMLLIVDDVWDVGDFTPFQVGGGESAVLVTTRANDIAQSIAVQPGQIYKLPILSEARSLELLKVLASEVVEQNLEAVKDLIRDLEGLPLALQVAGRLLRAEHHMGWGVAELLAELREGTRLLAAQPPADRAHFGQDTSPTVAVLLQRSTDLLDAVTRERFALLGVFAPKPSTFDLAALSAVWNVDDPRPTVRTLVNRGLMEPLGGGDFQVHALLVAHARTLFG